jgi:hypothetical protein
MNSTWEVLQNRLYDLEHDFEEFQFRIQTISRETQRIISILHEIRITNQRYSQIHPQEEDDEEGE